MTTETFISLSKKKIIRISKRNNFLSITDLNICNYDCEKLNVNHVIFGNKYIYLVSDFLLKGFVSGEANDNSWVYYDNIKKKSHYLSNLNMISNKNIQDFAGILGISPDLIVSICLVPNECDFKINNEKSERKIIVHYSSLNRKIRQFEKQDIGAFDKEQIYEQFKLIERRNNEENA